jgi:hypothetical protein
MGIFIDRNSPPTPEGIRSILGSKFLLWESLVQFVEEQDQIAGKWSFWGPAKSGWNLRYQWKGKALVALYPGDEKLIVNVVLGEKQAQQAFRLALGEKLRGLMQQTPQLRDGRWLFIPVIDEEDVEDIKCLLLIKIGQAPG